MSDADIRAGDAGAPEDGWALRLIWALDSEITTATDLLGAGIAMMLDGHWGEHRSAPAFTCLASGVERMLKLHLGLAATSRGGGWPAREFRKRYLHHLDILWSDVREELKGSARDEGAVYVSRLLAEVDSDPYWGSVMTALNSWADSSGRYRDFDILGGTLPLAPSARDTWRAMSLEVTEELDLLEELGGPGFQTALLMINERLCLSIFMWWHTLYRAWQHGLAGPQAKQASALLSPTTQRDVKDHAGALLRDR